MSDVKVLSKSKSQKFSLIYDVFFESNLFTLVDNYLSLESISLSVPNTYVNLFVIFSSLVSI